jgi:hypothetical protein
LRAPFPPAGLRPLPLRGLFGWSIGFLEGGL